MALATPLASTTAAVLLPTMTAASLLPLMAKLAATVEVAVPSLTCTVKLSLTGWPSVSAWVAALVLFNR